MATNRSRSYAGLAAVVIVLGGAAVTLSSLISGSAQPALSTPDFGVTIAAGSRTARPEDTVPKEILALPAAAKFDTALIGQARQIANHDGRAFWLIPGQAGQLCLIAASGSGDTFESAGTCAPRSQLKKGGIWFSEVDGNGDNQVALLTPDTVTKISTSIGRETAVTGNFAVLTVPKGTGDQQLSVVSASGSTASLDLGPLSPPAPTRTQAPGPPA